MRVKSIQLSWFRGAANEIAFEPDCKSIVVYGENGSGKSSFVDGFEFLLKGGRIDHLAHEHSGRHQEKGIINTHKPETETAALEINFNGGGKVNVEIQETGPAKSSGGDNVEISTWDYRRIVLRQSDVADFIHSTKGDKYSVLLPLLGLHEMEIAAENIRQLRKNIEQQLNLGEARETIKRSKMRRQEVFATATHLEIATQIKLLHDVYCADKFSIKSTLLQCKNIVEALDKRIDAFTADQKQYFVFQVISELNLGTKIESIQTASMKLADVVEPLITERLETLRSASSFVAKLGDATEINCPACNQPISANTFRSHIETERSRLKQIENIFDSRKAAIGELCEAVRSLKLNIQKKDVQIWRNGIPKEQIDYLDNLNIDKLRASCDEHILNDVKINILPVYSAGESAAKDNPGDVSKLSQDKQKADVAQAVMLALEQEATVQRGESLIEFLTSVEDGIRQELRIRSQKVINEISTDVQTMWSILHPNNLIDGVRLYIPEDTDKAIDVALRFYGVEQPSPRLTLSEGYRNSLGLCIFMAMAKREASKDRPVFLDDVVVSFDRNHRGMIVELLEKEFSSRQVIILTHDRDWYTELRQLLDERNWSFKTLLPYETPLIGIRWSQKVTTFDDARAQLKKRPDIAGNDARKIMDTELPLIAERLKSKLFFLRAEKNDRRTSHEFLERLTADAKTCFQKRVRQNEYELHEEATEVLANTDRLLRSWANRSSHTFDLVKAEAEKLINACEASLGIFRCESCNKSVWQAHDESTGLKQCQCGEIRWRYNKAA